MTQKQFDSLVTNIYNLLMDMPEMGLGEMNDCLEEAHRVANEWAAENYIEII